MTIRDSWSEGGVNGKRRTVLEVTVVLTGAGSGASSNKIPASAFGLTVIEEVSSFVNDGGDLIIVGSPNYDGTEIVFKAAATNAFASYTDTFRGTVKGY